MYAVLPLRLIFLLIDQAAINRHAIMQRAKNATTDPTIMKTKFCGRLTDCMYGAFAVGGTVGAG